MFHIPQNTHTSLMSRAMVVCQRVNEVNDCYGETVTTLCNNDHPLQ